MSKNGHVGLAQVIYSNVACVLSLSRPRRHPTSSALRLVLTPNSPSSGIRVTCQFNSKILYPDESKSSLWCSTPLENLDFSEDKTSLYADDCAIELSEDGTFYTIKSMNDERSLVNLKVTRTAPGFVAGKTGRTVYGTDPAHPWGHMRHAIWPRAVVEGTITTKDDGPIDFAGGRAFCVHAIQGMKPHHAAAQWKFVDFQGPTTSACLMEFTTPPSYGSTTVTVGAIARDNEIVVAGCDNTITHTATAEDPETGWPAPTALRLTWNGIASDGCPVEALIESDLEPYNDRVDVMAEIPGFVKKLVAGTVGTKPYIYQYTPTHTKIVLKMKVGDREEVVEEGCLFSEASFIC